MNTEVPRSKVISVLLFFVFMTGLLVMSLYVTGGLEGFISDEETIHIAFHESVTGLRKGSSVTLSGVSVGRVRKIRSLTSDQARNIVRSSMVVTEPEQHPQEQNSGRIVSGKQFLSDRNPLVLVSVRVAENAIPLNEHTQVSLITTDFTASQMIRFSAGSNKTNPELKNTSVVFSAGASPLTRLRSKFLEEREGVLRKENLKNISALIKNLKTVSKQLTRITNRKTEKKIDQLLDAHQSVASRLDRFLSDKPICPESTQPAQVETFTQDGTKKYRYSCPESGKEWVRDHPPKPGGVTRVMDRMNQLLKRLNRLTEHHETEPSIPRLVNDVSRLSRNLNQTSRSMTGVVEENRAGIRKLLTNMNQLSEKLDSLITQLEQDPSSAVFGRRGREIQSPYSK